MNEIRKWESTADSLDAIIISPMGTKTMSETNKFGFNGIECLVMLLQMKLMI